MEDCLKIILSLQRRNVYFNKLLSISKYIILRHDSGNDQPFPNLLQLIDFTISKSCQKYPALQMISITAPAVVGPESDTPVEYACFKFVKFWVGSPQFFA